LGTSTHLSEVLGSEGCLAVPGEPLQQVYVGALCLGLLAVDALQRLARAHSVAQQHTAPSNTAPSENRFNIVQNRFRWEKCLKFYYISAMLKKSTLLVKNG
jgi:hypothetical protein